MAQKFDALIIATGQAGPALAARPDEEGLKVASSSTASSAAPEPVADLIRQIGIERFKNVGD